HLDRYPGIDFLSKGTQVVAAGCQHWQGGHYEMDELTLALDRVPPMAPPELVAVLARPVRNAGPTAGGIFNNEELESVLNLLDPRDYAHNDDWVRLMMSVHHAAGDDAYEVFEDWCWGDPKFHGDSTILTRWKSLSASKENGVTYGSLLKDVREKCIADNNSAGLNLLTSLLVAKDFDPFTPPDDEPPAPFVRLDIVIGDHERLTNDAALAAVASNCRNIYYTNKRLVEVGQNLKPRAWQKNSQGVWSIQPMHRDRLREVVCDYVRFMKVRTLKGQEKPVLVPASCPSWLLNALFVRYNPAGIPALRAITSTPCLLKDGFILQVPGYNTEYELLYKPTQCYEPVPEQPTLADAQAAAAELFEVVEDFPFLSEAHRSVWLAAVLTMLSRFSFQGCVPLFFFDGNTSGVGKSLLIDTVGYITLGRQVPKTSYPPNNEEMDKRLTTIIREGTPLQLFDNVDNGKPFGSPALDAVITSGVWCSRVLGKSESTGDLDVTTVFCATGNNLKLAGDADAARRLAYCRIAFAGEDPVKRTDFRHEDLPSWILDNRSRLVKAALTILKAYHVAGSPRQKMPNWGSFEAWSKAVRAPLIWAGEPDPMDTQEMMNERANEARNERRLVVHGWHEVTGGQPASISDVFLKTGLGQFPDMARAIESILDPESKRNFKSIGWRVRQFADQPVDGIVLTRDQSTNTGRWTTSQSNA
ncbi:MAG: PriCT-2 domain-containing protein, partial [Planctomycetota bacterium]|nr:PriCT-2 domain-containing protein [Planctomycetota bacterium]